MNNKQHIVIIIKNKKGFINRLFRRKEQVIYVDGVKLISSNIKNEITNSFWLDK